jgi:hypothetical protein
MGSREPQQIAQAIRKAYSWGNLDFGRFAVYLKLDPHRHFPLVEIL